jgi:outer membrane protein OmpA-like peptidoglycan-associated protein
VRRALVSNGLSTAVVSAVGSGDFSPLVSKDSPEGSEGNSRVEVVISGGEIATLPLFWGQANPFNRDR